MTDQQAAGCPHQELAVGWALHALEPAEEILVAAHLPECAECTEAVAEAEQIGAMLGTAVAQHTPNRDLEQRIIALADTAQVRPSDEHPTVHPDEGRRSAPYPPEERPEPSVPAPSPAPDLFSQSLRPPQRIPVGPVPNRPRREPFCIPDLVKLLMIALVMLAISAGIIFLLVP